LFWDTVERCQEHIEIATKCFLYFGQKRHPTCFSRFLGPFFENCGKKRLRPDPKGNVMNFDGFCMFLWGCYFWPRDPLLFCASSKWACSLVFLGCVTFLKTEWLVDSGTCMMQVSEEDLLDMFPTNSWYMEVSENVSTPKSSKIRPF
jgi:hypothetical protein